MSKGPAAADTARVCCQYHHATTQRLGPSDVTRIRDWLRAREGSIDELRTLD